MTSLSLSASASARQPRWLILAVTLVAGAGCPGSKPQQATPPAAKACTSNQDCDHGWACLAARCYDTRKSAVFTHPEQMVTPDRVRQEVEHQQEQHMRRLDDDLRGADLPAK